jgi:hypothetical protein
MSWDDLDKLIDRKILGKKFDEFVREPPSFEASFHKYTETLLSEYKPRSLGQGTDGEVLLPEELKANHIHILGSTRQGKSKFLESLIRHDITEGFGCTLLDPSENASTATDVLKFCIQQNIKKVVWLDLTTDKLPIMDPLKWRGEDSAPGVVAQAMDSVALLWGQTQNDWQTFTRIQTYLKALFNALYFAGATLADAECFIATATSSSKSQALFSLEDRRRRILQRLSETHHSRIVLEEVFSKPDLFKNEFRPTIRRLDPIFDARPKIVFGSKKDPIDFETLIREKYVILVNLDSKKVGGKDVQRLFGTFVVNGLVSAMHFLSGQTTWKGRHYLYVDEAGLFVTEALTDIMSYQGKSGLWATIAHHYFEQFDSRRILAGVENNCHIKVLFFAGNEADRDRMLKNMYYGEVKKQAEDSAANLKARQAMIRIGKQPAQVFTVQEIPDIPEITREDIGNFKEEIFTSNAFYRTREQVEAETKERFAVQPRKATAATTGVSGEPPPSAAPKPATPNNPSATPGDGSAKPSQQETSARPRRSPIFDDSPGVPPVLRNQTRRTARKRAESPTEAE